ncbi:MAG: peptidoglycan DD-metalloendopeptidase family protein [candidate division Zixibacteria bacterium]|nr:peptidoglycan DD-metalloendopeptidase family protein [candidate division Zixibacteria bacterium]
MDTMVCGVFWTRPAVIVAVVVVMGLWTDGRAGSDREKVVKGRSALEQVQREVDQGRRRLDSLKAEEIRLQKASIGIDQRVSSEQTLLNRLGAQLRDLRSKISEAETEQELGLLRLQQLRTTFLDNIRQFYLLAKSPDQLSLSDPNAELITGRRMMYLTAVTQQQQGSISTTTEQLMQANAALATMTGKTAELEALRMRRRTNVALQLTRQKKAEKELAQVRRLSRQQADRLVSLEQSAREMEEIISRLEAAKKEAARRAKLPAGPSLFALQEGNLPWPYKGEIIQSFGPSTDPVTHLKSYSPGITIKGKPGAPIIGVAAGMVAYAGSLRGYGTFVIISHEDQYYTTYAGLTKMTVGQGDRVPARAKLGVADQDGLIRFELRKGQDETDPVKWLTNE